MNELGKPYTYSIIIPHKNIPLLLKRCLDSIPVRDDVQIIIVDDDSDPKVVDFNNFPGVNRPGVQCIFEKEGKGGGYARNIGLRYATGKWLLFADADDFFNYCINDILNEYKDSPYDIIYFKGNSVDTNTYTETYRAKHVNQWIDMYGKDKDKAELKLRYQFGEPWCKLIKRELVEKYNIHFDEIPIHNDTRFSYLSGFHAKTVGVDKRALYCVTTRNGSVSLGADEEKILQRIKVFAELYLFLRNYHIPVKENRHFRELTLLFLFNRKSYKKGLKIVLSMGIRKRTIYLHLFACISAFIKHRLFKMLYYSIQRCYRLLFPNVSFYGDKIAIND